MDNYSQEEAKIAVEALAPGFAYIRDFTLNPDLSIHTWPINSNVSAPTKEQIISKIQEMRISGTITHLATSIDPNSIALRCCLRYLMTCLNDIRQHTGMQPVSEQEHVQNLIIEASNGAGRKVDL